MKDNLSRVPYATYEPAPPAPRDKNLPPPPIDSLDRKFKLLRDAERTLKAEGTPVLLELDKLCLWVFFIHGAADLSAKLSSGDAVVLAHRQDFKDERRLQTEERLGKEWELECESTPAREYTARRANQCA